MIRTHALSVDFIVIPGEDLGEERGERAEGVVAVVVIADAAAHFEMRAERFFFDENKENYKEEEKRKHERARTMVLHPRLCKRSRTHEGCAQSHSLSFVVRVFVRVVLVVVPLV